MKKKLLIGFAVLAIALVAAFNINLNTQKAELSALSLANVEALANGETGSGTTCYYSIQPCQGYTIRTCGAGCPLMFDWTSTVNSARGTC